MATITINVQEREMVQSLDNFVRQFGGSPAVYRFPCEPLTEGFAPY
jgi:hypothetical protein